MKIEVKKLSDFLNKISMGGQTAELIMDFNEKGLSITTKSADNICLVSGVLNTQAFNVYEAIGQVGVQDISVVEKLVDMFKKEVEIKKTDSLLILSEGSNNVEIPLMAVEFISLPPKLGGMEFPETFDINYSLINDFITKATSVNKDFAIEFQTDKKQLKISNRGKFKFNSVLPAESLIGGHKSMYGAQFQKATASFVGNVTISLGTDFPIKVFEKTENSVIIMFIAPRVTTD